MVCKSTKCREGACEHCAKARLRVHHFLTVMRSPALQAFRKMVDQGGRGLLAADDDRPGSVVVKSAGPRSTLAEGCSTRPGGAPYRPTTRPLDQLSSPHAPSADGLARAAVSKSLDAQFRFAGHYRAGGSIDRDGQAVICPANRTGKGVESFGDGIHRCHRRQMLERTFAQGVDRRVSETATEALPLEVDPMMFLPRIARFSIIRCWP
jgi:hypothetical protein